jgi:hypothetical protein
MSSESEAAVSLTPAGTPFCPKCGAILQLPDHDPIQCGICPFATTYDQIHLPVSEARGKMRGRRRRRWRDT